MPETAVTTVCLVNIGLDMDSLLYRIIRGRLPFKVGDLNLYIKNPSSSIIFDSYEIYEETYNFNYMNDVLTLDEMNELIVEYKIWTESDQILYKELELNEDRLKLQAFRIFFDRTRLKEIKKQIEINQKTQLELSIKKNQLTHMTCESIATQNQWMWIIQNSTFDSSNDKKYDWGKISPKTVMDFMDENSISAKDFRKIARSSTWRQMWTVGKKIGNLFSCPSSDMTKDQLTLCSFSVMYDNVYDSSDCPDDIVIEDDDCLDGWFIDQKNKMEQLKKESKTNSISSKLNNAQELYIVAQSPEHAKYINDLNTDSVKSIKENRKELINKKGVIYGDADFNRIGERYNG